MATQAMTRERVRVLLFLMNIVTGRTSHFARDEAFTLLQRTNLVAMDIRWRVGSGWVDRQVIVNIIARNECERRPKGIDCARVA